RGKTCRATVLHFHARVSSNVALDIQFLVRRARADAHVAVRRDVDRAGGRAGPDAERQFRAAGHVADEEVGLVGADVPGLGREAAGVVLLEADGGGVRGVDVQVEDRGRGAEADAAGRVDEDRVGRGAGGDGERHLRAGDVLDRELARAAGGRVVGGQLPV